MKKQAIHDPGRTQYVTFKIGEELYGIPVLQVQEILRYPDVAPVPGSSSTVVGITNLRGDVFCVIDARTCMGEPPQAESELTRVIMIEAHEQVIGLIVDQVCAVKTIDNQAIEPKPALGHQEHGDYVVGVYHHNNQITILVDPAQLISKEAWADIGAI